MEAFIVSQAQRLILDGLAIVPGVPGFIGSYTQRLNCAFFDTRFRQRHASSAFATRVDAL